MKPKFKFHPNIVTPQDYQNVEVLETKPLNDDLHERMVNESERPQIVTFAKFINHLIEGNIKQ